MKTMSKVYVYLSLFAILTISHVSHSAILLNSQNILEIYNSNGTELKVIRNSLNINQLLLEQMDQKYLLSTGLDLSTQNDQTDSLSTSLQQNNAIQKYNWFFTKRFLSGTTLGLELTHLQNYFGTLQNSSARTEANQNYFTISIDQPLFPNFLGSQERLLYTSTKIDYEIKKIQAEFEELSSRRDLLNLYWKTKSLSQSVIENSKLILEYEKLARKVQQKKQNQFAAAGELEQALSEYELRKQSLKDDKSKLSQSLLELKSFLNIQGEIEFDSKLPEIRPLKFSQFKIENLKKYKLQNLKLQSAIDQSQATINSNGPQLSLYGKYTQSGYDTSNEVALSEVKDPNYKKYLVGLKLDYIFDNAKSKTEQKIKQLSVDIENDKIKRAQFNFEKQIEIAQIDLQTSLDDISSNKKILDYRKKAVSDISKNYFQGRNDISSLIEAYNKKNLAEINLINSYGDFESKNLDYQILTLE